MMCYKVHYCRLRLVIIEKIESIGNNYDSSVTNNDSNDNIGNNNSYNNTDSNNNTNYQFCKENAIIPDSELDLDLDLME